ncbi:beta-lactamase [Rhodotorula toruloides]|uniref:Beta-lactamase n=1 Tax=Rhodotorula toruloides TaxID=5286 RepID=A0A511KGE9_RHOTO|nr:beta-lactamase [Rhodotorula toruloides]
MLATAPSIDALLASATSDPYHGLPRAVVLAASSANPEVYNGKAGYAHLPSAPVSKDDLDKEGVPVTEDSVFEIFSCTKLVSVIACLQLVEQGKLRLEDDAREYVPELKETKVFTGFDEKGDLILEDNTSPITIKSLLIHTAGVFPFASFKYDFVDTRFPRVAEKLGIPTAPYHKGAVREWITKTPLLAKPDEHWGYGPNIDWTSLIVESMSGLTLEEPLGIHDMSFMPIPQQITMVYADATDPSKPHTIGPNPPLSESQHFGGAGLKGSPRSYLRILRMLMRGGELDGVRILRKETVDLMFQDQLETDLQRQDLRAWCKDNVCPSTRRAAEMSKDMTHGLAGVLTGKDLPTGRGAGAMAWSGLANTHWCLDREKDIAFVVWTNLLPWGDQRFFDLYYDVETELYRGLKQ